MASSPSCVSMLVRSSSYSGYWEYCRGCPCRSGCWYRGEAWQAIVWFGSKCPTQASVPGAVVGKGGSRISPCQTRFRCRPGGVLLQRYQGVLLCSHLRGDSAVEPFRLTTGSSNCCLTSSSGRGSAASSWRTSLPTLSWIEPVCDWAAGKEGRSAGQAVLSAVFALVVRSAHPAAFPAAFPRTCLPFLVETLDFPASQTRAKAVVPFVVGKLLERGPWLRRTPRRTPFLTNNASFPSSGLCPRLLLACVDHKPATRNPPFYHPRRVALRQPPVGAASLLSQC